MSLECTWDGFKRIAKEFIDAAPTLNLAELDNAWKCLGISYLSMTEPMWSTSAECLLNMVHRVYRECEEKLMENE